MKLELTAPEAEALRDLIDTALANMSVEIRHTDSREFREGLRQRREALRAVLAQLNGVPVG